MAPRGVQSRCHLRLPEVLTGAGSVTCWLLAGGLVWTCPQGCFDVLLTWHLTFLRVCDLSEQDGNPSVFLRPNLGSHIPSFLRFLLFTQVSSTQCIEQGMGGSFHALSRFDPLPALCPRSSPNPCHLGFYTGVSLHRHD